MMKTMQKGSLIHSKIQTKLRIAEKELENSKLNQKELSSQISRNFKENSQIKAQLATLREQNEQYFPMAR